MTEADGTNGAPAWLAAGSRSAYAGGMDLPPPMYLDALGRRCPEPLLMLRQAMRLHAAVREFVVSADDPLAHVDLAAFCARFGHDYSRSADGREHRIRRTA